jgi:DNA-binding transcriptional regulator LsrR (DeoR family)
MSARPVDVAVIERVYVLKTRDQLTHAVIARRIGLSVARIDQYVQDLRRIGRIPAFNRRAARTVRED